MKHEYHEGTEALCSGRGCNNVSIGTLRQVSRVPPWRCNDDRPVNQLQFDLVAVIHYCHVHEEIAKAYQSPSY
jgi:hypothetical protein